MPVFAHQAFLPRAATSLLRQSMPSWELVVVDDGSPDDVEHALGPLADDPRTTLVRHPSNRGLGAACNSGLVRARAPWIAYLPADDTWDPRHLARLLDVADATRAAMVVTGMRHDGDQATCGRLAEHGWQPVQVLHRRTAHRWTERDVVESDDLEASFFRVLTDDGSPPGTGEITCTWTDHPDQRHKHLRERFDGGLNTFRRRYGVAAPLRVRSRDSGVTDEAAVYAAYRDRPRPAPRPDPLRILLLGELAFNPDRVLALRDRGHELFGLWIDDPLGAQSVGPLPFDGVTDVSGGDWRRAVARLAPDVVYAQQNWRAVPLAHRVLTSDLGVPIVWHFKESPQRCITRGSWWQLRDLMCGAAACLVASPEEADWFRAAIPRGLAPLEVLDGDLPNAQRFDGPASPRRSDTDGSLHVASVGRPVGLDADLVAGLAVHDVHLHLYGLVDGPGPSGTWRSWLAEAQVRAPAHLHVHPAVPPHRWRRELSVHDAGLMHRRLSHNGGDVAAATWDDLNLPARIGTYAAAGLPLIAPRQAGHRVAVPSLIARTGIGILDDGADDLGHRLRTALPEARAAMARHRCRFTFDHHVARVEAILREAAR